jgi:2'-5' RNA ligase
MSRGATARLFVAVDPPPEVCAELTAWARALAGCAGTGQDRSARGALRVLDAQSLHLTLCFLGSRPVGEMDALGSALGACTEHVGELSVGVPLWLPPKRPRALAVEIGDPREDLARLQERVAAALAEGSGWTPQRRRFRAHITVARMRSDARPTSSLRPLPATPRLRFTLRRIALYRSWLEPAGATYESVASYELVEGAPEPSLHA